MGVSRFIASRLASSKGQNDSQSRISNRIAWISVSLSVAIMIVALTIVAGFKSELRSKLTGFMGSVMLVMPGQTPVNEHFPYADTLSYLSRIKELGGVESLSGVAYASGLLKTDSDIEGLVFKGVDSLYDFSFFENSIVEGTVPSYGGRISNDIMLSRLSASKMGYKVGDQVVIYFIGQDVKVRKFNLAAIYDAGLEDIDSRFAVADIRQIRRIKGWDAHYVSTIEVRLSKHSSIETLSSQIRDIEYCFSTDDDAPLFVTNIKEFYGAIFDWLSLLDLNVLMILVLMVIVAGFNMLSAVLIILCEHTSTIGLLKSLGMSDLEVKKVFLLRSWAIVGKGMLYGNILGLVVALGQKWLRVIKLDSSSYFVDHVPVEINVVQLLILNVAAALLIMLIVSISTHFISKISPDRTLRVD